MILTITDAISQTGMITIGNMDDKGTGFLRSLQPYRKLEATSQELIAQ
jgi:hypothetical protein